MKMMYSRGTHVREQPLSMCHLFLFINPASCFTENFELKKCKKGEKLIFAVAMQRRKQLL